MISSARRIPTISKCMFGSGSLEDKIQSKTPLKSLNPKMVISKFLSYLILLSQLDRGNEKIKQVIS